MRVQRRLKVGFVKPGHDPRPGAGKDTAGANEKNIGESFEDGLGPNGTYIRLQAGEDDDRKRGHHHAHGQRQRPDSGEAVLLKRNVNCDPM
jgi:hypothetical protein